MVLYGGVEWDTYDSVDPAPNSEVFLICHTGILYEDSVDPEPFFRSARDAVDEGIPIEMVFLGERSPALEDLVARYGLGNRVKMPGHRPYSEAVEYQKAAVLLLVFSCLTPYKIPSKIAQYVAFEEAGACH